MAGSQAEMAAAAATDYVLARSSIGCAPGASGPTACATFGRTRSASCSSPRSTRSSGEKAYLDEAEWVVAEVDRVLGRARGIRIGEEPDRDGQYFHYLAMWLFALAVLGRHIPRYRADRASISCTKFMTPSSFPGAASSGR